MEWLAPWMPAVGAEGEDLRRQLEREVARGHELYGVPVELLARGDGDDCLFRLLDGSDRVAVVHLVWQGRQSPPWPATVLYADMNTWRLECMRPEHEGRTA